MEDSGYETSSSDVLTFDRTHKFIEEAVSRRIRERRGLGLDRHVFDALSILNSSASHQILDPLVKAGSLLISADYSDVLFWVGSGKEEEPTKEFALHKFQLSTSSPVFYVMFQGSLPECSFVLLPDAHPRAFEIMVEYLYCGLLPKSISAEVGVHTLYLARKYMIPRLETLVVDVLASDVTLKNVLLLLEASLLYEVETLKMSCLKFIDSNFENVAKQPDFKEIHTPTMITILKSDKLQASEIVIFNAVFRWTRSVEVEPWERGADLLTLCLPYIRFPTMSAAEFADGPARFMAKEDVGVILHYICATGPIKPNCHFNTTPRIIKKEAPPPPALRTCECHEKQRRCIFCSGKKNSPPVPGRGQRASNGQNSTQTPPCFCPCRTVGSCPQQPLAIATPTPRPSSSGQSTNASLRVPQVVGQRRGPGVVRISNRPFRH